MEGGRAKRYSIGTKLQVWRGLASKTPGGLTKGDLMISKSGKVVSIKKHEMGKMLFKNIAGYHFKGVRAPGSHRFTSARLIASPGHRSRKAALNAEFMRKKSGHSKRKAALNAEFKRKMRRSVANAEADALVAEAAAIRRSGRARRAPSRLIAM